MTALWEEVVVEPNRVPAGPIVAVVNEYLSRQVDLSLIVHEGGRRDKSPQQMLAIRCDMKEDTLRDILTRDKQSLDFDTADLLLTKCALAQLWTSDLREVYDNVVLVDDAVRKYNKPARVSGAKVCAGPRCAVEFVSSDSRRKYCSKRCVGNAHYERRHKKGRYGNLDVCPNGHERTEETTYVHAKTGLRYCRICTSASEARRRAKETPEQREKRLQYMRDYKQRGKVAA